MLQEPDQHSGAHHDKQQGEDFFKPAHRQAVGKPHPKGRGEHADRGDAEKSGQIDIAQGIVWQVRVVPAVEDVAEGARHRNGQTDGGGRADGAMDGDVAPDHKGHRQRAAADTHQTGDKADYVARPEHAGPARQFPARFGFFVQQKLGGDGVEKDHEDDLQGRGGEGRHQTSTDEGAGHDADDDTAHHQPVDRAAPMMGHEAGDGGEDNGGKRGAQGQMHHHH